MTPKLWTPRQHQVIGSDYLFEHQRCSLWAHPGLGKTSMSYRLFDLMNLCGSSFLPALVVAPLAVARDVWPAEQQKWTDFRNLRVVPIVGTAQQRLNALLLKGDIYTTNYENIVWLVEYFGERWPFKMVIADESTKLRSYRLNGGGKRSTALSTILDKTGRWVNLTGTPSPKGLESLWGQQYFVDRGQALGHSYTDFMKRWFFTDPYTKITEPRANAREEIYGLLGDTTMALRAEDWLDVRKPNFLERRVHLAPEVMSQYKLMEKKFFAEMPDGAQIIAWQAMAKSGKLIQMASGSVYSTEGVSHQLHNAKLEDLRSCFDELGEPLLVAYHYKSDLAKILAEFPEARVYKGKKDEDLWVSGKLPMMLLHPASAGHGLNLQDGGRAIYFYTNTWDLELRLQVLERIGPARQLASGYDRAVLVYDCVAHDTIDDNVMDRLMGRANEQDALMAARARALS